MIALKIYLVIQKSYKMKLKPLSIYLVAFFVLSCANENNSTYKTLVQKPELFQQAMQNLTDIVVYDIFSPPVASRVYLYPTLAAYEIVAQAHPDQMSIDCFEQARIKSRLILQR